MEKKLDEIIEKLQEIKSSTGEGILTFLCFVSLCTTCNYVQEIKEEQHKTNVYLKMDYNKQNTDTIINFKTTKTK